MILLFLRSASRRQCVALVRNEATSWAYHVASVLSNTRNHDNVRVHCNDMMQRYAHLVADLSYHNLTRPHPITTPSTRRVDQALGATLQAKIARVLVII